MAKKRKRKSKSQFIREYLANNPGATPNQIVEGLSKKRVKVTPGLASNVKYTSGTKAKKKGGRKKVARKRGGARRGRAVLSATDLFEAQKLVNEVGGIAEARKALDLLEKLK